jgi:hypothetical protein
MELLQIATTNTTNGNSRRTWILIRDGAIVDGEREECGGRPERFRDFMAARINVSPKEWRAWNEQLAAVIAWDAKVAAFSGVPCAA